MQLPSRAMAGVEAPAAATAADRLSDPITRWHSTDAAAFSPRAKHNPAIPAREGGEAGRDRRRHDNTYG